MHVNYSFTLQFWVELIGSAKFSLLALRSLIVHCVFLSFNTCILLTDWTFFCYAGCFCCVFPENGKSRLIGITTFGLCSPLSKRDIYAKYFLKSSTRSHLLGLQKDHSSHDVTSFLLVKSGIHTNRGCETSPSFFFWIAQSKAVLQIMQIENCS